ncbi:MAG: UDP-4-amino-4,6-dideoxy-N-acetyl-beta-L-altrosamine transaminase [Pelotomaculum sp. PtaB.Bin013]|nr:MAG: UDP-4-amino-4,6-dideoxy-N-acetyl-beta-L-altrosamine transaminase [Pelotomaculum sp. PtaB.Bin013]
MTDSFIPYAKQQIDEEDIDAVVAALRSDWLTTGPQVARFEQELANTTSTKHAVVFSSGTAALHAAYFTAGVRYSDEVITTPLTFAATANAALYLGAKPVFVDIESGFFNINPALIEKSITNRTKVIAPVDMAGQPAPIKEIMEIGHRYGITVVEDAAHALGARYKGKPVGTWADMTILSFHPVKHITCGEGGAVLTNDQEYYERLLAFRSHGVVRDPAQLMENHGPWHYEMHYLGYNYRLTDIQCALGLNQLKKLDKFLARRREIAYRYNEAFIGCPHLATPMTPSWADPAWHLYVLRLAGDTPPRRQLVDRLSARGIGTQVHYLPVYRHPYYQGLGYRAGLCPNAEDYYRRALTIPLYPAMNDEDVKRVIDAVLEEVNLLYCC